MNECTWKIGGIKPKEYNQSARRTTCRFVLLLLSSEQLYTRIRT